MATQLERLATLEAKQKAHEEKNASEIANLSTRMEDMETRQKETHSLILETNSQVGKLVTAWDAKEQHEQERKGERRQRKMDLRDWIIIAIGFGTMVSTLAPLFIAHAVKG